MIHSIRSAGLSLAALLALGVGAPAHAAIDLVGATNVTFQWTSPTGPDPIDSYLVFVSRNGSTFGTTAQLIAWY